MTHEERKRSKGPEPQPAEVQHRPEGLLPVESA